MTPEAVVVLVGALVAASCALVGTFLVLRGMSLLGDAVSHAVLPGIAIAFFLAGERAPIPMVLGAGALGLLTVFLVGLLVRTGRVHEDASIGVVFPALFALGVVLVSRYAAQVDLDLDCVLYGEIAYAPLDVLEVAGYAIGPKALWVMGAVFLLDLLLVAALYKELAVTTFDPAFAAAVGISPVVVQYLLMGAVSVTVVGAFESVGAILVVAMLVVPPAAAYLLTDRLGTMLAFAAGIGVAAAAGGYAFAHALDVSIAGGMAVVAGAIFSVALVFAPRHGLLAAVRARRRLRRDLAANLVLLHLRKGRPPVPLSAIEERFGWPRREVVRIAAALAGAGLAALEPEGLVPTPEGLSAIEAAEREGAANGTGF